MPYARDPETLVRQWVVPGTPGLEHRIGGLEKQDLTGNVSYDPANHELMVNLRAKKVERVANSIPEQTVVGSGSGKLLVVGWGGTYGSLFTTVNELQHEGQNVDFAHFNYINPLPKNTGDLFSKYDRILVCELNLGQFAGYLKSHFPGLSIHSYHKVQGQPFTVSELKEHILEHLNK